MIPRNRPQRPLNAFTLVELLVVIGIIALLISILLPSLSAARRAAQRTACSTKLHNMLLAATLHRNEHKDYYPLAGFLTGGNPSTLDDAYAQKYDYYTGGFAQTNADLLLCPISTALETEMQGGKALYSPNGMMGTLNQAQFDNSFLDPNGMARDFLCPAHATSPLDIKPMYEFMWCTPLNGGAYVCQPQSYIFNEYVLGFNTNTSVPNMQYLQGKGSLIRQPAQTFFAADGVGGSVTVNHGGMGALTQVSGGAPMFTIYTNTALRGVTLADAFNAPATGGAKAGDASCFDPKRHAGKINVAFFDGHVELRNLNTGDLAKIYVSAP
jgi:prepilin-type processing-associated H-X9-DG protein/prepilin-type N-terminal cleavage/methylation domain-containing protein